MSSSPKEGYSFSEVCEILGTRPAELRRVLRDFGREIGYSDSEPEASSRFLAPEALERARRVLAFKAGGMDYGQIVERLMLDRSGPLEPSSGSTSEGGAYEVLLSKIEHLEKEVATSEQRRVEERDKTLTTLARTQQEVQRLKNEVAIGRSRAAKRRKSFWERLFGD
jgi:hypothetical protein